MRQIAKVVITAATWKFQSNNTIVTSYTTCASSEISASNSSTWTHCSVQYDSFYWRVYCCTQRECKKSGHEDYSYVISALPNTLYIKYFIDFNFFQIIDSDSVFVIYFSVWDKGKLAQSTVREVVMYGKSKIQCETHNQTIKLKCVTAWGYQADHFKPCVSWWQRPPIVLSFDLGPADCFPCGADVDTRSAMLARAKHNWDSQVENEFLKFFFVTNLQALLLLQCWSCAICGSLNEG